MGLVLGEHNLTFAVADAIGRCEIDNVLGASAIAAKIEQLHEAVKTKVVPLAIEYHQINGFKPEGLTEEEYQQAKGNIFGKIQKAIGEAGVQTPVEANLDEREACVLAWSLSLLSTQGNSEVIPANISLARVCKSRPSSPGSIYVNEIGLAEILADGEMRLTPKPSKYRVVYGDSPVILPLRK